MHFILKYSITVIICPSGIYARRKIEPVIVATHLDGQTVNGLFINHPFRQNLDPKWICPKVRC